MIKDETVLEDVNYILINAIPENSWTGDIPAIASGAIALCALGTSLYQAHLSRKHNKLSVLPHMAVHCIEDEDTYRITLRNDGLGPATITKFNILCKKNNTPIEGEADSLIVNAIGKVPHCQPLEIEAFSTPFVIPSNKEVILVTIKFDANEIANIDKHIEELLELQVTYQSIYKENFSL